MARYLQQFVVEGRKGTFPTDMLRYDYCYPTRTEDALELGIDIPVRLGVVDMSTVQVHLTREVDHSKAVPTAARWASFGWRLVEGSVRNMKR